MYNEILLITDIAILYSLVVIFSRLFGRSGLYVWVAVASLLANIEVMILVKAFSMEMTLGNVLFASTFLATDIVSELYGKKEAKRAAFMGILSSCVFLLVSRSWFLFTPAENDIVHAKLCEVFSNSAQIVVSSLVVYAVVQLLDVWLYHFIWNITEKKSGNSSGFLWLRNNLATLISQLVNAVLYTFLAFYGIYPIKTLVSVAVSSYVIFIVTSLLDTPFLYLARALHKKEADYENMG